MILVNVLHVIEMTPKEVPTLPSDWAFLDTAAAGMVGESALPVEGNVYVNMAPLICQSHKTELDVGRI